MRSARRKSSQTRWTRDAEKEKYWTKQIALWQDSGLSVRAFCKEHGVVETSFYAWRRELIVRARESDSVDDVFTDERITPNSLKDGRGRTVSIRFRQTDHRALESLIEQESTISPFVPLKVVPDEQCYSSHSPDTATGVTVKTPSGYEIAIGHFGDVDLLAKILKALEGNR